MAPFPSIFDLACAITGATTPRFDPSKASAAGGRSYAPPASPAIIITPTAQALTASALNCARTARLMGLPGSARAWIADARAWRTGRYPVLAAREWGTYR